MNYETEKNSPQDIRRSKLIEDYNVAKDRFFHTPEDITNLWDVIWQIWGRRGDILPAVPHLKAKQHELAELEEEGKMFVYLPYELVSPGQSKYLLLNKIFPETATNLLKNSGSMEDEYHRYGWIDIEASIETPYSYTTETELTRLFSSQNRAGQRLSTYIIGSQFSKLITGHYFDHASSIPAANKHQGNMVRGVKPGELFYNSMPHQPFRSRLLGTRMRIVIEDGKGNKQEDNSPLEVTIYEDGRLSGGIGNKERKMYIGGRSEGTKFSLKT